MQLSSIESNYIINGIDPYFAHGHRANLRYATKDYLYAALIELNPNGIDPLEYLYYAKADLLSNDTRGAINAVGNIKRAIHLLIDDFLEILGLGKVYSNANFPAKLEIIEKLEAFPIRLLKSLNSKRNIIEHDYAGIDCEEAEQLVELAEIFLKLCYPYLRHTVIGTRVGSVDSDKDIEWILNPDTSVVVTSECSGSENIETEHGIIYYNLEHAVTKTKLDEIKITKSNVTNWIPYLNTFVYCTQKRLLSCDDLPPRPDEDQGNIHIIASTSRIL